VIVVDTSVWIDYFVGSDEPHVQELDRLIEEDAGIALTDVVLTEVLQGIRSDRDMARVEEGLAPFDVLRLETLADFRRAAELYRTARQQGVTIRRTLDCLIASVCVRDGVPIHHNDQDFSRLAGCSELTVHGY
jgi:predicted nucleic acid-binding protein